MNLHDFAHFLDTQLRSATAVGLLAHQSPDGDAYGSLEAMSHILTHNYTHLKTSIIIPPEAHYDDRVSWIIENSTVTHVPPQTDVLLLLDTASLTRTALTPDLYPKIPIISIDHHETPTSPVETIFCDQDYPSTTALLTDIAQILGWSITPHAATALLLGLYTDTGGFIHRNSNERAFSTAAYLLRQGADNAPITQRAFGNYTLRYLQELGNGLLHIVQKDDMACLFFPPHLENNHIKSHIIGYLSGILGVNIACVLLQKGSDVKVSLRTRGDMDVNDLAKKFDGGGHKKAAGFTLSDATLQDDKLFWNEASYTPESFIHLLQSLR